MDATYSGGKFTYNNSYERFASFLRLPQGLALCDDSFSGTVTLEIFGNEVASKMDKTAIDLKYLLEGLGTIDTDKVILNWINNLAPIFMREDKFDFYDYVYVFMPIKEDT